MAEPGKLLLLSPPQMIVCLAAGTGFMDGSKPWRSQRISQMDEGVSQSQLDIQLHFSPLDLRGPFEWIPSPHKQDSCSVSERFVSCIQELNISIYIFSSGLENGQEFYGNPWTCTLSRKKIKLLCNRNLWFSDTVCSMITEITIKSPKNSSMLLDWHH